MPGDDVIVVGGDDENAGADGGSREKGSASSGVADGAGVGREEGGVGVVLEEPFRVAISPCGQYLFVLERGCDIHYDKFFSVEDESGVM